MANDYITPTTEIIEEDYAPEVLKDLAIIEENTKPEKITPEMPAKITEKNIVERG